MQIRIATALDAPAILALSEELERVHREHHPGLYRSAEALVIDSTFVARSLGDPNVGLLVAASGGVVCGFVRVVATRTPEGHALLARSFARVDELAGRARCASQRSGKFVAGSGGGLGSLARPARDGSDGMGVQSGGESTLREARVWCASSVSPQATRPEGLISCFPGSADSNGPGAGPDTP